MTIEAFLHNGKEIKINLPMDRIQEASPPKGLPVYAFQTSEFKCPGCQKRLFALFRERYRHICFCLESICLTKQKEASIAAKRSEPSRIKETGAEKFHLGRVYKDASLPKWIGSNENHGKVLDWTKNQKTFLILQGVPGSGKSYLAAALLNYLYEKGEEITYTTHRRFIEEIHFAMQSDKTQHSVISRHADKKFLIIDDLGSTTNSEWQQEMILELIDRRYSDKQKTIITTNFTKEDLRRKLGERTASRLLDKQNEILEFWSTDRRSSDTVEKEKHWEEQDY